MSNVEIEYVPVEREMAVLRVRSKFNPSYVITAESVGGHIRFWSGHKSAFGGVGITRESAIEFADLLKKLASQ